MPYTTYVLQSLKTNKYYTGHTNDIDARLKRHNLGQVNSTKNYRPWVLVHTENFDNKKEAYKREFEIKSYKGGLKFKKLLESV